MKHDSISDPFVSPAEIAPLIHNHEKFVEIFSHFLSLSPFQHRSFLENAERLNRRAKIEAFNFCDEPIKVTNSGLELFNGIATSRATEWCGSGFHEVKREDAVIKAVDQKGLFSFIFQDCGKGQGYLILADVSPEHRRQGVSKKLIQAIHEVCFTEWDFTMIYGRAAIPLNDAEISNWRSEKVVWRIHPDTGVQEETTALHRLWLKSPLAIHGQYLGSQCEPDSFFWLSPYKLKEQSHSELVKLDKYHPKKRKDSFVQLIIKAQK